MKNKMLNFLVIILLIVAYNNCYTQSWGDKLNGYIIKKDNIEVKGIIKFKNHEKLQNGIIFYANNNPEEKLKYKPGDIKGFSIGESYYENTTYSPLGIGNKKYFLLLVIDGQIKFYKYYYEVKDAENRTVIEDSYLIQKGEGKKVTWDGIKFAQFQKGILKYVGDCPELKDKIESKEYQRRHIEKIIKEYNTWYSENN